LSVPFARDAAAHLPMLVPPARPLRGRSGQLFAVLTCHRSSCDPPSPPLRARTNGCHFLDGVLTTNVPDLLRGALALRRTSAALLCIVPVPLPTLPQVPILTGENRVRAVVFFLPFPYLGHLLWPYGCRFSFNLCIRQTEQRHSVVYAMFAQLHP
jgi:hypothetical protein